MAKPPDPIMDKLGAAVSEMLDDLKNPPEPLNENAEIVTFTERLKAFDVAMRFVQLRDKVAPPEDEKAGIDDLRDQLRSPPPNRGSRPKIATDSASGLRTQSGNVEPHPTSFVGATAHS